jgi:hypothetical protein
MAAARSPERTVVFAQRGSVSVVDARYLGFAFKGGCDRMVARIFRRGAGPLLRAPGAGQELVGQPANRNASTRW